MFQEEWQQGHLLYYTPFGMYVPILKQMHAIICADSISFFAPFFLKKKRKEKSEIEQLNLGEERSKLGLVVVGFHPFGNYLFSSHMKEIERKIQLN